MSLETRLGGSARREIGPDDFPAFFRAVNNGLEPFPWQCRLLREVMESGWPGQTDMQTAAGKTAMIDIAVYALALDSVRTVRSMPLRTVYMVDRRLVVDNAHVRALRIADCLAHALAAQSPFGRDDEVLAEVASRLAAMSGGGAGAVPLQVAVMRGGLPRDNGWVESASQPTIILSTVDQVGSRLLFRGYGVSRTMAPVHAGLLGEDTLMFLDEVQLSAPFMQTLEAVRALRERASKPLGLPFSVMGLSATPDPAQPQGRVFRLDMDRAGPDRAGSAVLDRRFAAAKHAGLVRAPANGGLDKQARVFVDRAKGCAGRSDVRVVGVVVNRVRLARRIHDLLAREFGEAGENAADGGSILLTGRCRPLDRDTLLGLDREPNHADPYDRVIDRISTGRDRRGQILHRPTFVVGTQAIEAGADLDFDALVTEIAPWPSLRQRFGRLDRAGELGATQAWVVCTYNLPSAVPAAQDPVYGAASWNTRTWLWTLCGGRGDDASAPKGTLDIGVDGQLALGEPPPGTVPGTRFAPRLSPAVMDLFAQTFPRPDPDPDPALWLHGPNSAPAEVQVVWRADMPDATNDGKLTTYVHVLAATPPTSAEALSLPVWSARAWLSGLFADAVDLETADAAPVALKANRAAPGDDPQKVFVWGGVDASGLVPIDRIRPGSTIILPSAAGGCDRFGWVPEPGLVPAPTRDISEAAILRARNRAVIRIHPSVLDAAVWARAEELLSDLDAEASDADLTEGLLPVFPTLVRDLGSDPVTVRYAGSEGEPREGIAFVGQFRRTQSGGRVNVRTDLLDDDDLATLALGRVPLLGHCEGVGRDVDLTCAAVGLRGCVRADLVLGGRTHDYGKAEVRFKAVMWNEGVMAAVGRMPLAKSLAPPGQGDRWSRTLERSGLPRGARHECWSVVLVDGSPLLDAATDPDLVLWTIGTHHGRGRPFFDPVDDPFPVIQEVVLDVVDDEGRLLRLRAPVRHGLANVSAGWTDRFDRMIARYGHWGLAYLEAVVRLSDARRSRVEAEMIQADRGSQDLFTDRRAG